MSMSAFDVAKLRELADKWERQALAMKDRAGDYHLMDQLLRCARELRALANGEQP